MFSPIDDTRIQSLRPLLPPAILLEEIPLDESTNTVVAESRKALAAILRGEDDRLIVITGPCSIHDPVAALEYAVWLKEQAALYADSLYLVMRVYFEKPRTVVGWKGLINDPDLDGSFNINKGLRTARGLLRDVLRLGLPTGTEFLDTIIPQFLADCVSWGAIGARTTESQVHRELSSGLSMPVGFKNGTGGNVQIAIDAIRSARAPHWFPSVTKQGVSAIFCTKGNEDGHLILRGGARTGPNYNANAVAEAVGLLNKAGLPPYLMVDCSHGNSEKDHRRQPMVAASLAERIAAGDRHVAGVMLESHLVEGRQDYSPSAVRGQSITDACIGLTDTASVLSRLAKAVQTRRG
jgi:3-deoxy-7-phosphoheptulonate synthase